MLRGSGALLIVLLAFVTNVYCEHPCEKVSNATECVWYTDDNEIATFVEALQGLQLQPAAGNSNHYACVKLFISEICVNIDFDDWGDFFTNVTLSITLDGITIWSDEVTLPQLTADGGYCLDDNTVLEILLLIPETRNATIIIGEILEWTGCEPRGLFSLCFFFTPYVNETFSGCFSMDFQLLYWHKWCLYKAAVDLGCVGTPPPAQLNLPRFLLPESVENILFGDDLIAVQPV